MNLIYLVSDTNDIKESLCYIIKKIESGKANNVNDFKDMGKATWRFISFLYESGLNKLIANNNNHSFRYKVKAQFTPKINKGNNIKKGKESNTDKPAFISKLSFFFFKSIIYYMGTIVVYVYRRNYVWSINTLIFLYSYPIQRTTKELNS